MFIPGCWFLLSKKNKYYYFSKLLIIFIVNKSKTAQIYFYEPQSAGTNMQSSQSESTSRRLSLELTVPWLLPWGSLRIDLVLITSGCHQLWTLYHENAHFIIIASIIFFCNFLQFFVCLWSLKVYNKCLGMKHLWDIALNKVWIWAVQGQVTDHSALMKFIFVFRNTKAIQ